MNLIPLCLPFIGSHGESRETVRRMLAGQRKVEEKGARRRLPNNKFGFKKMCTLLHVNFTARWQRYDSRINFRANHHGQMCAFLWQLKRGIEEAPPHDSAAYGMHSPMREALHLSNFLENRKQARNQHIPKTGHSTAL